MEEVQDKRSNMKTLTLIVLISDKLKNGDDLEMKIEAAREIRSMIRNRSSGEKIRSQFGGAGVIKPLVGMLSLESDDAVEISLLALLNLASKNKRLVFCFSLSLLISIV